MSALAKKILSLFRGRHDYVAVGADGAFSPANEAPTETLVDRHLAGEESFGFYVMMADSRIVCTCVDFDNKPDHPDAEFESKAIALYSALRGFSLCPLLERSQSGSGYHVWLFFTDAVPAYMVRAWWRGVERRLNVKFKEVYPRQDKLAGKGLGNLVRYPLWKQSVFIDPDEDMRVLEPDDALDGVVRIAPEDLPLLAFQLGMGELRGEPVQSVVTVDGGADCLLPIRVQKLLERTHSLFSRRWNGDTEGMKDSSNSAIAMCLAVEMVRLYVPTPEIASAIRYWCRIRGAEKGEREDWIARTVTRAYDFILTRQEERTASETTFEKACQLYIDTVERGKSPHISSGLAELDASIDGAGPGEMVVIAARPGHGKSAFAFQWLNSAAMSGIRGLLISEEMSAMEVGKRRLLSIATAGQEHWDKSIVPQLRAEVVEFHKSAAPVFMLEGCNTIDRVEEVIDQFVSVHGIGIAAVDYLQLLTGRTTERYEIVTEMSRRLKQCARRNRIPILVLSQLNREIEKRAENEPKLSDLRESGQIEQDADLIIFTQWPYKFDPMYTPNAYRIYCAKRRNGPIRSPRIETSFNPNRQIIGVDMTSPYRGEQ